MLRRWDQQSIVFGNLLPRMAAYFYEGAEPLVPSLDNLNSAVPGPKTNARRLNDINYPHDEIPYAYIDYIFEYEIMNNPVMLDNKHIMDYDNLKKWWEKSARHNINPVTNIAYRSLTLLSDLKVEIEEFVGEQVRLAETAIKEMEEKIRSAQLKRQEKEQELIRKLNAQTNLRTELSIKIAQLVGEADERTLSGLFSQLDHIDKKIKKLKLGNAYHNDPRCLQQRILQIMTKREHHASTTRDEEKLRMLFHKLEDVYRHSPRFYSRLNRQFSFFRAPHERGLLAIINPDTTFSVAQNPRVNL